MLRTAVYSAAFIKGSLLLALVAGCVTINVYFPAAAAEKAADRFINDVLGPDASKTPGEPQSHNQWTMPLERGQQLAFRVGEAVLNFVIPAAHAEPDLDMSSPAIQQIKSQMQQRHKDLKEFYDSGAIGYTANGLVAVRDQGAIPLAQRNQVRKLVADENADRERLYREIAVANGHPEWEDDIRATYAKRWIAKAAKGWYYQNPAGSWTQN